MGYLENIMHFYELLEECFGQQEQFLLWEFSSLWV